MKSPVDKFMERYENLEQDIHRTKQDKYERKNAIYEKILPLIEDGYSAKQISEKINVPVKEVKDIIRGKLYFGSKKRGFLDLKNFFEDD